MRMSRLAWLSRFFPLPPTLARSPRVKREPRAPKLRTWVILGKRFRAATKSEARAMAKRELGYKNRLPVGLVIVEEKER